MNREQTASLIAVLCAAFPHVPVTRETVEVYHAALTDLNYDACNAAIREMLLTVERFPPPATIRRKVAERAGVLAPAPGEAWGEVLTQARVVGARNRPVFTHPAITRVTDQIGWGDICMSTSPDTVRAHFLRAYEVERTASDTRTLTEALVGLPDGLHRPALGVGA